MGTFDTVAGKMFEHIDKLTSLTMKKHEVLHNEYEELIYDSKTNMVLIATILSIVVVVLTLVSIKEVKNMLGTVIGVISDNTRHVEEKSEELMQDSVHLSNLSSKQSSSVEEILASLEETMANININSENVDRLEKLGENVIDRLNDGYEQMKTLSQAMGEISNSSQEVNSLVSTIDEIAFQTNLLALNAAVEAARAGEQGLGFAVVSDEVRNLATRSATEANKIHNVISKAVEQANKGTVITDNTNESFNEIFEKTKDMMKLINENSVASKEEKTAIEQLQFAMTEVDNVAQTLSVSSDKMEHITEDLREQARIINDSICKLEEDKNKESL
jgi:methyl-accepting chemotaxis protein